MKKMDFRIEKDTMGEVNVPVNLLYGAQTGRAVENFPISGLTLPFNFIRSIALIKKNAAITNFELGLLDKSIKDVIIKASNEVIDGKLTDHFVVDIFQTGSGTSTNMNVNEVITNRANQLLGYSFEKRGPIHPNDHVNMGQSSNDVIPSSLHLTCVIQVFRNLIPELEHFIEILKTKESEFKDIIKIGRTHLQDATPITLGMEFSSFRAQLEFGLKIIKESIKNLAYLTLGGTAVGTGINAHKDFGVKIIEKISLETGLQFHKTDNHFKSQSSLDTIVHFSGVLKTIAISLMKIANDIRWLSSGPRCGIGEIKIPAVQPGSSIMPGKINPVIAESVCQVAAQVIGNDTTITIGGQSGNFQLNVMMPVISYNIIQSIDLLSSALKIFGEKCIKDIEADIDVCNSNVEKSLSTATPLALVLGYDKVAEITKKAFNSGKTIKEVAIEENILSKEELSKILDPKSMI